MDQLNNKCSRKIQYNGDSCLVVPYFASHHRAVCGRASGSGDRFLFLGNDGIIFNKFAVSGI